MSEQFHPETFLWETQQSRKTMMMLVIVTGALSAFVIGAAIVLTVSGSDYAIVSIGMAVALVVVLIGCVYEFRRTRRLERSLEADLRAFQERQARHDG